MPSANKTTNLALTQYQAGETISFLQDYNADMRSIDEVPDKLKEWAKGTFINDNQLINGDFRKPINQRGQTTYTGTNIFTIDRWKIVGNNSLTVTINSGSITLTNTSDETMFLYQEIENGSNLQGENITTSADIVSYSGTCAVGFYDGVDKRAVITSTGIQSYTAQVSASASVIRYVFALFAGASITVKTVKLELGSVATPFVPRPYGGKLALCQRFYRPLFFTPKRIAIYSSTYVMGYVEYDRSAMRATPIIVNSNASNIVVGNVSVGTAIAGFEISLSVDHHWVRILATKSAHGLTDAILTATDSSLPLCYLDAEIY